jgi:hypothetical protein
VRAILEGTRRADSGQALAEYAIALGLMAGLGSLRRTAEGLLSQPQGLILGAGAVAVVLVFAFTSRR